MSVRLAKFAVPVNVGEAERTTFPVPVEVVTPVPPLVTGKAVVSESDKAAVAPDTVRAPETVRLGAERAVVAPHWKTVPYIVIALELAVMTRYFIEVPLG